MAHEYRPRRIAPRRHADADAGSLCAGDLRCGSSRRHLVGVDLLPLANGDYVVLEVNGAVELTTDYSLAGRDVFEEVAKAVACDETAIDVGATGFGG